MRGKDKRKPEEDRKDEVIKVEDVRVSRKKRKREKK